jgi:hypothetical protein
MALLVIRARIRRKTENAEGEEEKGEKRKG